MNRPVTAANAAHNADINARLYDGPAPTDQVRRALADTWRDGPGLLGALSAI